MLLDLKTFLSRSLTFADGEFGRVKDFYFDDKNWVVRYIVADTGDGREKRVVLIAPHALGAYERPTGALPVPLTKRPVANGPMMDENRPVSRQYEEHSFRYYGWPAYRHGGAVWGVTEYSMLITATAHEAAGMAHVYPTWDDIPMRSVSAVTGYKIAALDGVIGSVSAFLADSRTWLIREIVVETGSWYSSKQIRITPSQVLDICYGTKRISVSLLKTDIENTAQNDVVIAGAETVRRANALGRPTARAGGGAPRKAGLRVSVPPPEPESLSPRAHVSLRAHELARQAGRESFNVVQEDYEQAKRELTGESENDRQNAVLDAPTKPVALAAER